MYLLRFYTFYVKYSTIPKKTLNSFKVFEIKRKLGGFSSVEGFFELHSSATEGRKGKNRAEISNFLAN
jgi:hypothetical protein